MRKRLRGRFALGFAVAALLAFLAAALWTTQMVVSWQHECRAPGGTSADSISKPMSAWPPGARCIETKAHPGAGSPGRTRTYVHQAIPGVPTAIFALGGFASVALLSGIVAGVRDRRRRQPEPPPLPDVP